MLVLWLAGCGAQRVHTLLGPPAAPREATLEELMELVDQRYQEIRTLKALVKINAKGPEGKTGFYGVLIFQRPDHLRFQALDSLGRTVFDLLNKAEETSIYLPQEDRYLAEGIDAVPFIGKEQVSLIIDDFMEILGASGGAYLDPALIPALEKNEEEYIVYLFYLQDSRAVLFKKLWLERLHLRLSREEIFDPAGERRLTLLFEDYQKVEEGWRPLKVKAQARESYQFDLEYSEIKINPVLKAEDFSLVRGRR